MSVKSSSESVSSHPLSIVVFGPVLSEPRCCVCRSSSSGCASSVIQRGSDGWDMRGGSRDNYGRCWGAVTRRVAFFVNVAVLSSVSLG